VTCSNRLLEIIELKLLINRLLAEINELKKLSGKNPSRTVKFIINEINERNIRVSNLMLYNVPESISSVIADKITYDLII